MNAICSRPEAADDVASGGDADTFQYDTLKMCVLVS